MSLLKSRELFGESAFPITVDTVVDRTLIQKDLHRHERTERLSYIHDHFEEPLMLKRVSVLIED